MPYFRFFGRIFAAKPAKTGLYAPIPRPSGCGISASIPCAASDGSLAKKDLRVFARRARLEKIYFNRSLFMKKQNVANPVFGRKSLFFIGGGGG